jgi:putative transposase
MITVQLYAILDYDKKMNNLQLPQKDMEKEIAQLESFIKSDIDARELKRAIAVRMALSGKLYYEISKILGVSEFFVGDWKNIFKTQGIEEIKLGYKGSQGYLTERQTDVVVEWLKNKHSGNLDELVTYVEQEFGVIYKSKQSYYELFAGANISWKKTQKVNPKSDKELVKKKR